MTKGAILKKQVLTGFNKRRSKGLDLGLWGVSRLSSLTGGGNRRDESGSETEWGEISKKSARQARTHLQMIVPLMGLRPMVDARAQRFNFRIRGFDGLWALRTRRRRLRGTALRR